MFQDTPQNPGSKISLKILTSSDEKSQNGAYITGFKNALGEWVILLDADMISYTLMIDRVISEMFGSQDVIRTFRVNFSRKSPFRKIGSWIINAVFNFGNDKKLRDVGSSLSAYRQNIYRNVYDTRFNKYHFFLPFAVVALAEKNKIKEIPIEIPPTKHTGSAYSICALLRITFKVVFMKILTLTSRR